MATLEELVRQLEALPTLEEKQRLLLSLIGGWTLRELHEVLDPEVFSALPIEQLEQLAITGELDLDLSARAVVQSFVGLGPIVDVRPREEDYALAFVPEVVERAREGYAQLFARHGDRPTAHPGQTRYELRMATSEEVGTSPAFPGGYERIAHLLLPGRTWVSWRYLAPGATTGLAYDGLVWLDDHWAWFPKPWRVIA